MTTAEDELWELWQGGWGLKRYVEEFLELSNRGSWHDASLGACFHLGLKDKPIRCELPTVVIPWSNWSIRCCFLTVLIGKSKQYRSLVIPLQLERVAPPQLTPCREPPHTSPTAPPTYPIRKTLLHLRWSHPAHLRLRWSHPAHLRLRWPRPAHFHLRWSHPAHLHLRWSHPAHLRHRWAHPAHLRLRWSRPAHCHRRWVWHVQHFLSAPRCPWAC